MAELFTPGEQRILKQACTIMERRMTTYDSFVFRSSEITKRYLAQRFAGLTEERFSVLWLNNRHRLIFFETLFNGTVDGAAVYPRVVVKRALEVNAAAVIFAHNHPSGEPVPSEMDYTLTERLKEALGLVDVRVLDHMVVGGRDVISMSEQGSL